MADDLRCSFCDRPATLLCDGRGCDRPLCREHATRAGRMHLRVQGGGRFDSIDYCPDCVALGRGGPRAASKTV